jgi:hypothetical protein
MTSLSLIICSYCFLLLMFPVALPIIVANLLPVSLKPLSSKESYFLYRKVTSFSFSFKCLHILTFIKSFVALFKISLCLDYHLRVQRKYEHLDLYLHPDPEKG